MKNVVLITGSELRHTFFRKYLGVQQGFRLLRAYCETDNDRLQQLVAADEGISLRKKHLMGREQTERDFFELFCDSTTDTTAPVFIPRGEINTAERVQEIIDLNPDIIISYGCSIIKPPLIEAFPKRFINIHLGLSPYYRGSGTNYFPFVNDELAYIGVTFMYIDAGVDTGEIFHQIRPRITYQDNVHSIGNRLISDLVRTIPNIIEHFDHLQPMERITIDPAQVRYYKVKDFTEASLERLYQNMDNGMIERYLTHKQELDAAVPIIENPALNSVA